MMHTSTHLSDQPDAGSRFHRRDALKMIGASVFLGGSSALIRSQTASALEAQAHSDGPQHPQSESHEVHSEVDSRLDLGTALPVGFNFARHVVWGGAVKGKELGPRSAVEMNALAGGRIALLKAFGGKEGGHLADHEYEEILHSLGPVPILVGLSDATTACFRVDPNRIFATVAEEFSSAMHYSNVVRPALSADTADWKQHLDKVNADLKEKIAEVSAVTSVLSPLGTTYSSSQLANSMKGDVMHIVYEQSYAMAVLEEKSHGVVVILHADDIHEIAEKRADVLMNGTFGYSKLMMTLAANTQGSCGIGDPPEIYFAINHVGRPDTLAIGHGFGAVNSEFYTILLNALWMRRAGIFDSSVLHDFLRKQTTTVQAVLQSLTDGKLRTVTLNQGRGATKEILEALAEFDGAGGAKLREVLRSLPPAKFQASIREWCQMKLDAIAVMTNRLDELSESLLDDAESFASAGVFTRMRDAFLAGDVRTMQNLFSTMERQLQDGKADRLAGLFEDFLADGTKVSAEDVEKEASPDEESDTTAIEHAKHSAVIAAKIVHELMGLSHENRASRLKAAQQELGLGDDADPERIRQILSRAGEDTIQKALAQFTKLSGTEDVVPGIGEAEESSGGNHHKVALLGHSAREVLFALLTQIPSVPALARMAKLLLPTLAGVHEGEALTANHLKRIVMFIIPIEAGLSATADNVAAYLFAEVVLRSFFAMKYGDDVFARFPMLETEIGVITVKMAEQAGSLTKVGNGPNFSQHTPKIRRMENPQGIGIDMVPMTMPDTLKNGYSWVANGSFVLGSIAYLWRAIDRTEKHIVLAA